MRAVVALAGLGLAVSAGCQSGASAPPAPAEPATAPAATVLLPAARPAGITAGSGSGAVAGSAATVEPARVRLPRSPDTAVRRTRRPIDAAAAGRLAAIEFPDFEREDGGASAGQVSFRHTTRTRPYLAVSVTMGPCSAQRACPAVDLASWNARRDQLARQLPEELRGRPDTRFEIGARDVAGAAAIYTYQLGYAGGTDDHHQPSADYTDSYVLSYNDGVNQIRVNAHYADDPVGGLPQLLAIAPPEDLEKLAVAFASFYLRAWP
jgi:hypothetical protein